MGLLDFLKRSEESEEKLRATARQLLYAILTKERAIERWEANLQKVQRNPALAYQNEIRAKITQLETLQYMPSDTN